MVMKEVAGGAGTAGDVGAAPHRGLGLRHRSPGPMHQGGPLRGSRWVHPAHPLGFMGPGSVDLAGTAAS